MRSAKLRVLENMMLADILCPFHFTVMTENAILRLLFDQA